MGLAEGGGWKMEDGFDARGMDDGRVLGFGRWGWVGEAKGEEVWVWSHGGWRSCKAAVFGVVGSSWLGT